jgi:hypothetical protein
MLFCGAAILTCLAWLPRFPSGEGEHGGSMLPSALAYEL